MPTITGLDPAPSGGFSGNELIAVDLESGQTVHASLSDLAALVVVDPIAELPIQSGGLQATDLIAVDHGDGVSYQYTIQDVLDLAGTGATNLGTSVSSTTVTVTSDTGTDATLVAATGTDAGVMTAAMQVKLAGIATGATANSSDATLLARANHTGTQAASTISDFSVAVDDRVAALLVEGQGIDFAYVDGSNTFTISITPPSSLPIHSGGLSGLEQVAVDNGSGTVIQVTAQEIANLAGGSGQSAIQFQDEGSNLGTSGTVTTVDFVGSGVTVARVSNTLTVTIDAASGGGSGGSPASGDFYYQSSAPSSPTPAVGSRWVDSDTGVEYTYIDDGTSFQWVEVGTSLDAIGGVLPVINGGTGTTTLAGALAGALAGSAPVDLAADSKELRIGASADLRLYHDGTNSVIENDTGDLVIKAFTDLDLQELTITTASPSAGGAGALPATPLGYLNIKVDGVLRKFPFYA